jgi:hypothetical protein
MVWPKLRSAIEVRHCPHDSTLTSAVAERLGAEEKAPSAGYTARGRENETAAGR